MEKQKQNICFEVQKCKLYKWHYISDAIKEFVKETVVHGTEIDNCEKANNWENCFKISFTGFFTPLKFRIFS